jgi:hypothetical protein
MDTFRTIIRIESQKLQITHRDPILFLGSCFSENIGNRMISMKFPGLVNPFGVIFNPASVAESIRLLIEGKVYSQKDLTFSNGLWFSFHHHGSFSDPDRKACLDKINSQVKLGSEMMKDCKFLSITFGTSWIYRYRESGNIVANCHKLPESAFDRQLLSPDDIVKEYSDIIKSLRRQIPAVNLIFTISPIRHLRDGMEENQFSKAILHLAVKKILEENENCFYFPAYEIMMDDLRDYRFYEADMVHPNSQAIDYIWDRFIDAYMDKYTRAIIQDLEKIASAMHHRPLQPGSNEFKMFCEVQLKIVGGLKAKYPYLSFETEETHFKNFS